MALCHVAPNPFKRVCRKFLKKKKLGYLRRTLRKMNCFLPELERIEEEYESDSVSNMEIIINNSASESFIDLVTRLRSAPATASTSEYIKKSASRLPLEASPDFKSIRKKLLFSDDEMETFFSNDSNSSDDVSVSPTVEHQAESFLMWADKKIQICSDTYRFKAAHDKISMRNYFRALGEDLDNIDNIDNMAHCNLANSDDLVIKNPKENSAVVKMDKIQNIEEQEKDILYYTIKYSSMAVVLGTVSLGFSMISGIYVS